MEGLTEKETTNVIEVQFKRKQDEISHDIAHPASKHYLEEYDLDDDPLYDLLHEFDDALLEEKSSRVQEDFIFHLVGVNDVKLSMDQSALEMSEEVLTQVERLKEDFKRIKFYLDEMNIDD